MDDLDELVAAARLETVFFEGGVRHIHHDPQHVSSQPQAPIEDIWNTLEEIGAGAFGVVRLQRRNEAIANPNLAGPHVRAVKDIPKTTRQGHPINYTRELEAIVKFSQPRYYPYFALAYGWFENDASLFIAMEYFPSRDLFHFKESAPPFSEDETSQIVSQLVAGVRFMHESGYAHRDLKPGNILIASTQPSWQVKIADFGISKQTLRETTQPRSTAPGTFGYMAPETMGYFAAENLAIQYTMSVDIWAVGVIALELLVKRPVFSVLAYFSDYVYGHKPLDFRREGGGELSDGCRKFIATPNPIIRLTASAALADPWLLRVEASLFVQDDTDSVTSLDYPDSAIGTPASTPSQSWTQKSHPYQTRETFEDLYLDSILLLPKFQTLTLTETRYFVLRSDNATDIETSVAHDTWTSSPRVNKMLEKAYLQSGGQVVLFFSVILSRRFCGVARMTSAMDWANTDEHWLEDTWQGRFTLEWLCLTELPFDRVRYVPVKETTPGYRAISCYDGTQICTSSAYELMRAFSAEERIGQERLLHETMSQ